MLKQRTLKTTIKTTGVGLHTGARVDLVLRPAAPDTGIVFHRVDLPAPCPLPADARHVGDTRLVVDAEARRRVDFHRRARACRRSRASASTTLHIDVAGPEIPIMDGSAGPFVFLLQSAGIVEQNAAKKYLRIVETRRGARRRQVGALRPVPRLQARLHDRLPASDVRLGEPAGGHRFRRAFVREAKWRVRERSASCRTSRRCARRDWASAAACRTRSCWTISACSTPKVFATTTNSSSTRCWTRSAISTCSDTR